MNIRLWISRLVIVLMGGGLLFVLALPTYASHNFVYNLQDDLDADDVDGIVDLNGVGLDRSHMSAQNKLWLRWQWDVHQLEAGEALHGCMLFDATANGLADYALCVSLDESLAIAPNSPTLYSCNNQKDDHCGSNPVVTPASSVVCMVFTDVNDIFGDEDRDDPQASTTFDTRVRCSVVLDELNDATPMNVCSYTAMPPESAAEDCVFEPSTTAFLVIEKNAGGDVNTSFDFALSPAGRDGESSFQVTGAAAYPPIPINADTDHTLSEVNLTNGWVLEQAGCEVNQQAVGNFDSDHNEISNIKVIAGQTVLCTFKNRLYGEITFNKKVVGGDAQPNQWRFAIHGGQSDIAHNQTVSLPVGEYTVHEDGGATNNANYALTAADGACTLDNGAILLTVRGLSATCTLTNTVRSGPIVVKKETTPEGASESFTFSPSYGNNFTLSDNGQHDSGPLEPGVYSVQEIDIPPGWRLDQVTCSDGSPADQINLELGETVTCIFYNSDLPSELLVVKNAQPTNVPESGGNVTYRVLITNTSAADSVKINQVADDHFGALEEFCMEKLPVTLAPQASLRCTFSDFIKGPAGSSHTNVVTVSGVDDNNQQVSGQDSASVTFGDTPALLTLVKTAKPSSVPESGGEVEYSVIITNASSADAVTINSVQDDRFGNIAADCRPTPTTTLQPGDVITCLFTRFLQGNAGEQHINQVTVSGSSDDGQALSAQDQASVRFTDTPSSMTISKKPSRPTIPASGALVTFTVELNNSSAVDTLTLNDLTDSVYGKVANSNNSSLIRTTCRLPQKIAAGKSYLCQFAVLLAGSVGDQHTNLLTANARDDDGATRTATAQASVLVSGPQVTGSKRDGLAVDLNNNGVVNPGDTISYTVVVRNGGNAAGQFVFADLVDANTTVISASVTTTQGSIQTSPSSVTVNLNTLAPNQQATIRFSVRVADPLPASVTKVTNQGLLTSDSAPITVTDDPDTASPNDPTITPLSPQTSPDLTVLKRDTLAVDADQSGASSPGDTLEYLLTVANNGSQTAIDVLLEDTPSAGARLVVGSVQTSQGTVIQGNQSGASSVAVQLGALAMGQSVSVRFRVIIQKPLPTGVTQINNQALVSGDNFSPTPSNDPDTPTPDDPTVTLITAVPALAAFQRDKLLVDGDDDRQPSPGDTLVYQVTIHNTGSQDANQVVFAVTPDPHTALVVGSVQRSQGVVNQGNGAGNANLQVALGVLAPGGQATITYQVVIANPLPIGVVQVGAQGTVSSSNAPTVTTDDPDTSAANDPTRTAVMATPVLEMTKRDLLFNDVDGDEQVSVGDMLVYVLRLTNVGNVAATDVLVEDMPDVHTLLQHGKVQVSQGEVERGNSGGDRQVLVKVDALPPNETINIGFRVTIQETVEVRITNQGQAHYNNPNAAQGASALSITSDDPDTPTANDPTVTPVQVEPDGLLIYLPLVQKP